MKKMIITAFAILLIGISVFAYWKYFYVPGPNTNPETGEILSDPEHIDTRAPKLAPHLF